jgi:hypothetical protein
MGAQSWIQFGLLMMTLIGLALHAERRFTRMEAKMDILWEVYLKTRTLRNE